MKWTPSEATEQATEATQPRGYHGPGTARKERPWLQYTSLEQGYVALETLACGAGSSTAGSRDKACNSSCPGKTGAMDKMGANGEEKYLERALGNEVI